MQHLCTGSQAPGELTSAARSERLRHSSGTARGSSRAGSGVGLSAHAALTSSASSAQGHSARILAAMPYMSGKHFVSVLSKSNEDGCGATVKQLFPKVWECIACTSPSPSPMSSESCTGQALQSASPA